MKGSLKGESSSWSGSYYWVFTPLIHPGLSLRAGGRGFSPAAKRVAPAYFYRKIEEK